MWVVWTVRRVGRHSTGPTGETPSSPLCSTIVRSSQSGTPSAPRVGVSDPVTRVESSMTSTTTSFDWGWGWGSGRHNGLVVTLESTTGKDPLLCGVQVFHCERTCLGGGGGASINNVSCDDFDSCKQSWTRTPKEVQWRFRRTVSFTKNHSRFVFYNLDFTPNICNFCQVSPFWTVWFCWKKVFSILMRD